MKNVYKCTNGIVMIIPEGAEIDLESIATAKQLGNPLDDLTKITNRLDECRYFENSYVFLDSFSFANLCELFFSSQTLGGIIWQLYILIILHQ